MNSIIIPFDQVAFGKRIKQARKKRGLTRVQLGLEFGVTEQAVGNWERGRNCPGIECLAQLCGILHISVHFLLTGVDLVVAA